MVMSPIMDFIAGGADSAFSPAMARLMQNPEQFGSIMAEKGVPPPTPTAPPQPQLSSLMQPQSGQIESTDFAPQASNAPAPQEATANPAASPEAGKLNKLMSSFRGVQAPKPPEMQRIQSPSAPRPHAQAMQMDPRQMIQMLMGLGGGGGGMNLGALMGGGGGR